jgi:hypothetical protein
MPERCHSRAAGGCGRGGGDFAGRRLLVWLLALLVGFLQDCRHLQALCFAFRRAALYICSIDVPTYTSYVCVCVYIYIYIL